MTYLVQRYYGVQALHLLANVGGADLDYNLRHFLSYVRSGEERYRWDNLYRLGVDSPLEIGFIVRALVEYTKAWSWESIKKPIHG